MLNSKLRPIVVLLLVSISMLTYAQQYGNEWIDYSKTYYSFDVAEDGLYRIPFETLNASGIEMQPDAFRLYSKGELVPIYVSDVNNFGPGDYIEFVGERNTGYFDTQLYANPNWQPNDDVSLFSDKSRYFLISDASVSGGQYTTLENELNNPAPEEDYFIYTNRRSFANVFTNGDSGSQGWTAVSVSFSDFESGEGFVSPQIAELPFSTSLITEGVNTTSGLEAIISLNYVPTSNTIFTFGDDHHFQVKLNGDVVLDHSQNGLAVTTVSNTFSASSLGDPLTPFSYEHIDDLVIDPSDGNYQDKGHIAYVEYSYPRNFTFGNDPFFQFESDNTGAFYFEAADFDGGNSIVLYDLNNGTRQTASQTSGVYPFNLEASAEVRQLVLASTQSQDVNSISTLEAKTFTDYSDPANIGDYVMVYHHQLREGSIDQVERYKNYRSSIEGGNHQVLMADVTELYDQFAHGIRNHSQGIRNFTNFIFDQANNNDWDIKPEFMLLLGRSINYRDARDESTESFSLNLVPTYGDRGSDNLLSAKASLNHIPLLATGRLSASNGETINGYLNKLIVYESLVNEQQECSKEARQWMKNFLHLGGGNNEPEADQFGGYLDGYGDILSQTSVGGEVVATFVKDVGGIIETPPILIDHVDNGLNTLTLFGHSNAEIFDFGLAPPEEYNNGGKYPFLMSNSCFIGDVHQNSENLFAFEYVHPEERGFIAFLATVGFGFPSFLNNFTSNLFENATGQMYGEPLGKIIVQTHTDTFFDDLEQFGSVSGGTILHSQEFSLQGDPALPLYHFDRPEYLVEASDVFVIPAQPTVVTENIELQFVLNNLGKAINDSIEVLVDHLLPDGSTEVLFLGNVAPVAYRDTLSLNLPNDASLFGLNGIRIFIDPNNSIEEDCEDNNQFTKSVLVLGDQPFPIEPCDLAIVSGDEVVLKANSPNPIMTSTNYLFQIDTEPSFDSPNLETTTINQIGGVLTWEPGINYIDGQVYYWRVTRETANPVWQNSSFVYKDASDEGWAQTTSALLSVNEIEDMTWNADFTEYALDFGLDQGVISSPRIGPASSWSNLEWDANVETNDSVWIEVWSTTNIQTGENATLLISDESNNIDLSDIDAEQYPYLTLNFFAFDELDQTPGQLNSWEVYFDGVPELSFNQSLNYAFSNDTIANSADGSFLIGLSNVNQYSTTAIETECRIIGSDNVSQDIECPDLAALEGLADGELAFSFETNGLSGQNLLQVEINPNQSFREKFNFNNLINLPFFVRNDNINPLVDVSFDGVNIMHNELVSSEPDILIQIRDENTVQALVDTSIADIFLEYPSGLLEQISLDDPDITFTPADIQNLENENVAHINFQPSFTEDGIYTLSVKASDANGNQSSNKFDYITSFEVVTTNSISNVVNYPNPFTTSTQFVYTLAGNEIPSVFRIQVMTVTGRVVREFDQSELGVPKFGKNISDFVWDGTDTYGNELANGVYFFRVIANTSQGEALELYTNEFTKSVDDSFGEYSIGKMYKVR